MKHLEANQIQLIIISGPPASGKSTLARNIRKEFGFPVFSADSLKEILFDDLGTQKPKTDKRQAIGKASFDLLYHTMETCVSSGTVAIFEAHFYPPWSEKRLKEIIFGTDTFYIHCTAENAVIERRFRERASSAARHPGHRDSELIQYDTFPELLFESDFRPDIGAPVHTVDTTDLESLDLTGLMTEIENFLK